MASIERKKKNFSILFFSQIKFSFYQIKNLDNIFVRTIFVDDCHDKQKENDDRTQKQIGMYN